MLSVEFHWSESGKQLLWQRSGPILLHNIKCIGNESYIWKCTVTMDGMCTPVCGCRLI